MCSGEEKFKQGKKVGDTVFDGSTGEEHSTLRRQRGCGLGILGASVFEVLGFVSNHTKKRKVSEHIQIPGQGAIGGDDQIKLSQI